MKGRTTSCRLAACWIALCAAGLSCTSAADPVGTPAPQPAAAGDARVGLDDPRGGYESAGFETRSRALPTVPGDRLDLAALAASPPLGLPPLPDPPDARHIDLGRQLFYDRNLAANGTLSCGMCHVPEQAFTQNELATPVGIEGRFVRRNAPALYNVGYRRLLFHDGRESSLTDQIWSPLLADNEMGNPSREDVLRRIGADPGYAERFARLFDDGLTARSLGAALAAYQRALLSANAPFDRWYYGGDTEAIPAAARRGFFIFTDAGCQRCHTFSHASALFTDDALHRTGVEFASRERESRPPDRLQLAPGISVPLAVTVPRPERADEGAWEVTGREPDRWRYRTPSLRNVALTAPYMHDGSLPTLASVVDFYDAGAGGDPGRDPRLTPLDLSREAKSDLIAFLEALTGDNVDALAADARSAPIGDRRSAGDGGRPGGVP